MEDFFNQDAEKGKRQKNGFQQKVEKIFFKGLVESVLASSMGTKKSLLKDSAEILGKFNSKKLAKDLPVLVTQKASQNVTYFLKAFMSASL